MQRRTPSCGASAADVSLLRLRGFGCRCSPGPCPVPLLLLLPLPPRTVAGHQRLRLPYQQRRLALQTPLRLRRPLLLRWRLCWVSGRRGQGQQALSQPVGDGRPDPLQRLQPNTVGVGLR